MPNGLIKIFSGNANHGLAQKICQRLGIKLTEALVGRFADGEIKIELGPDTLRGKDVFFIQPGIAPNLDPSNCVMELILMIDAAKRASAKRITAVMPYFSFARQDRTTAPRTPISAKAIADIITAAGANRFLTIEFHSGQIQGFFNIPVDNLFASPIFIPHILRTFTDPQKLVIISPDAGGVKRARAYAKKIGCSLAVIDKEREVAGIVKRMEIIGNVNDLTAIILDDMMSSAGTVCQASIELMKHGAKEVHSYATHPVFTPGAVERIEKSALSSVMTTDTVELSDEARRSAKIKVLTASEILAEAIRRIHNEESVGDLFETKFY